MCIVFVCVDIHSCVCVCVSVCLGARAIRLLLRDWAIQRLVNGLVVWLYRYIYALLFLVGSSYIVLTANVLPGYCYCLARVDRARSVLRCHIFHLFAVLFEPFVYVM